MPLTILFFFSLLPCSCRPVAHPDSFSSEHLGVADLVETLSVGEDKITKFLGIKNCGKTVTVLVRGSNEQVKK